MTEQETKDITDKDIYDSWKYMNDEASMMPLVFKMNGCKFRYDVLKMVHSTEKFTSLRSLILAAEEVIDWVNNEQKNITTNYKSTK
jgi:hypothetical protein